jgi:phenylalanyl-tRNA synthetase beta subunit
MNILIPHNWLLEHLETKVAPQEIARCLSLCGPSVERIHEIEGEPVYDIEVTTNRVDMMSVRGIAREAAAILPEFGHKAILKNQDFSKIKLLVKSQKLPLLDLKITDKKQLSRRILAVKMKNVTIKPSSDKIQNDFARSDNDRSITSSTSQTMLCGTWAIPFMPLISTNYPKKR